MTHWTALAGTMLLAGLVIAFAIQTAVLAVSIWILSGKEDNPFVTDGQIVSWGKCAGIVAAVLAISFLPSGGGLALVAWFVGVMTLFHCNFGQAFMIILVNFVFSFGINWALVQVLS